MRKPTQLQLEKFDIKVYALWESLVIGKDKREPIDYPIFKVLIDTWEGDERKFIGIEQDEKYFEIAKQRINEKTLFDD